MLAGALLTVSGLAAPTAAAADSLLVRDFVLTHGIAQREPTDNIQSFTVQNSKVFAFARIGNHGEPTTVNFVWHYGGERHAEVPLGVGTSSGWRTWSSAQLRPGDWSVQLVDADGLVLSEKTFTVGMAASAAADVPDYQSTSDADVIGNWDASDYQDTSDVVDPPETMFYPSR
jgi:hypothetical protein